MTHPADSLFPFPPAQSADYKNWHDHLMFDTPLENHTPKKKEEKKEEEKKEEEKKEETK